MCDMMSHSQSRLDSPPPPPDVWAIPSPLHRSTLPQPHAWLSVWDNLGFNHKHFPHSRFPPASSDLAWRPGPWSPPQHCYCPLAANWLIIDTKHFTSHFQDNNNNLSSYKYRNTGSISITVFNGYL